MKRASALIKSLLVSSLLSMPATVMVPVFVGSTLLIASEPVFAGKKKKKTKTKTTDQQITILLRQIAPRDKSDDVSLFPGEKNEEKRQYKKLTATQKQRIKSLVSIDKEIQENLKAISQARARINNDDNDSEVVDDANRRVGEAELGLLRALANLRDAVARYKFHRERNANKNDIRIQNEQQRLAQVAVDMLEAQTAAQNELKASREALETLESDVPQLLERNKALRQSADDIRKTFQPIARPEDLALASQFRDQQLAAQQQAVLAAAQNGQGPYGQIPANILMYGETSLANDGGDNNNNNN